jgi:hypothetical protein
MDESWKNSLLSATQMNAIAIGVDFRHEIASTEAFSEAYIRVHIRAILADALEQAVSWYHRTSHDLIQEDRLFFNYKNDDPRIKEAVTRIVFELENLGYTCKSFVGKQDENFVALIELSWKEIHHG